jgi:hypothetical protein
MDSFEKAVLELTDLLWEEGNTEGYSGLVSMMNHLIMTKPKLIVSPSR